MTAKEKVLRDAPGWSEEQARAALAAVEGRIVDEWGDLQAQTTAATSAVMRRLDEQERAEFGESIGEAWGRKKRR